MFDIYSMFLVLRLDLSAGVSSAVEGSSACAAVLAATPEMERELGPERETLGPVDHEAVGLDEDVVLETLLDPQQVAVDALGLCQGPGQGLDTLLNLPDLLEQQHVGEVEHGLLGGQLGPQRQPGLGSFQRLTLSLDCSAELLDVLLLISDLLQCLVEVRLQLPLGLLCLLNPLMEGLKQKQDSKLKNDLSNPRPRPNPLSNKNNSVASF